MRRAQIYSQAVPNAKHLPHLYDVADKSPTAVWLVVQWLDGRSLEAHLPQNGPLPDRGKLTQLLVWMADICEAISALHKQRQSPSQIHSHTIVLSHRPRGAFLIDPVFSGQPHLATIEFPKFDPAGDMRQLAVVLYWVATHKPTQTRPASDFNPAVSQQLDETIQNALNGGIKNAHALSCVANPLQQDDNGLS